MCQCRCRCGGVMLHRCRAHAPAAERLLKVREALGIRRLSMVGCPRLRRCLWILTSKFGAGSSRQATTDVTALAASRFDGVEPCLALSRLPLAVRHCGIAPPPALPLSVCIVHTPKVPCICVCTIRPQCTAVVILSYRPKPFLDIPCCTTALAAMLR